MAGFQSVDRGPNRRWRVGGSREARVRPRQRKPEADPALYLSILVERNVQYIDVDRTIVREQRPSELRSIMLSESATRGSPTFPALTALLPGIGLCILVTAAAY